MRPRGDELGRRVGSVVGSCLILVEDLAGDSFFTLGSGLGFGSFGAPASFLTRVAPSTFGLGVTDELFLTLGSFLVGVFFSAVPLDKVDGCGILSPVIGLIGPGPMLGSFNQASVSFELLAVCFGRLDACDGGCSVSDLVVFFDGFEEAVPSAFLLVDFDGAVLAFLAGDGLLVALTGPGNPGKASPKLILTLMLLMFPEDSDCFRFLPATGDSLFTAGTMLALYWAFAFLSAAAYSFFISASMLTILEGTISLD